MPQFASFLTSRRETSRPASTSGISSTGDANSQLISSRIATSFSQNSDDDPPHDDPMQPLPLTPLDPDWRVLGSSSLEPTLEYEPPPYQEARIPIKSITYQFSALQNGAYILVPSSDAPDSRPVYNIRSSQSIFSPSVHETIVRRGAGDEGQIVGEFAFGISSKRAYISFHGKADYLARALRKTGKPSGHISPTVAGHWTWALPTEPTISLCWNCENPTVWTCSLPAAERHEFLAEYRPPFINPQRILSMPTLEVSPTGQQYFDQIVVAALILEQKSALPVSNGHARSTTYFNF